MGGAVEGWLEQGNNLGGEMCTECEMGRGQRGSGGQG